MGYTKKYQIWHKKKELIDGKEISRNFYYHEREVWWTAVGVNVGVEIDGKHDNFERPVLIMKKLNKHQFFGIPLTSGQRTDRYFYYIEFGNLRSRYLCLSQLRVFSSKRLLRRIDRVKQDDFVKIKSQTQDILFESETPT